MTNDKFSLEERAIGVQENMTANNTATFYQKLGYRIRSDKGPGMFKYSE